MDFVRESAVGQLLRWATSNRVLLYPEERDDFSWPPLDALLGAEEKQLDLNADSDTAIEDVDAITRAATEDKQFEPVEKIEPLASDHSDRDFSDTRSIATVSDTDMERARTKRTIEPTASMGPQISRHLSRPFTQERLDVERQLEEMRSQSIVLAPTKTADGTILVEWYTSDDPANPQNWSSGRKWTVLAQLAAYSMAVYGASSMYVSGEEGVMKEFHVGATPAALGLAIYVIGYGLGPLLWAPLSEIPAIGRNWIYIPTYFLFVILSIPTAVVKNYAGLLVLRFLTGFFGSPCLSNGGASVGDMYGFLELPIYLSAWTVACFWGPALGPVLAGFAVQAKGWRWGLWEIVWLNAPILIACLLLFPETSADNILLRRAQRLRKRTGLSNIKSQSEINQALMRPREIAYEALIKPMEITIKDPAVLFTNIYTALTYGIYYSFFEVFPLVYPPFYGFNIGEVGLVFVSIGVGCIVALVPFLSYQIYYLIPDIKRNGLRAPEHRLVPALIGVVLLPVGYFMFGWTARPAVHWIVSIIGVTILVAANFFIFQSVFIYLPLSYPKYAASLFAANDTCRAMFAAACVLFSRPMFINLGVGGGVSLLAGLSCLGVLGMFFLWHKGAWLRSKSTFAEH